MSLPFRILLPGAVLLVLVAGLAQVRSDARPQLAPAANREEVRRQAEAIDGLQALVVERRGEMWLEEYFEGADRDSLLHLRSATKSVLCLLVGIALDRGRLDSLDQTLGELLGAQATRFGPDKAAITLRDLLTMTAGLEWNESSDVDWYNRLHRVRDPVALYLEQPRTSPRGELWTYSSGASHVISAVLSEATGMPAAEFARRHLFAPLGIERFRWSPLADGHTNGAAGLELRPVDTLKLGRLVLAKGVWEGRQVVPAEWIAEATRAHADAGGGSAYGLHWWIDTSDTTRTVIWHALGFAAQSLTVVPEQKVVIVVNCRWRTLDRPVAEQVQEVVGFLKISLAPLLLES